MRSSIGVSLKILSGVPKIHTNRKVGFTAYVEMYLRGVTTYITAVVYGLREISLY